MTSNDARKNAVAMRQAMRKKRPNFVRQDAPNLKRLRSHWRRPKGVQSKLRCSLHGHGCLVKIGYGSPQLARGVHRSGLVPVSVHTEAECGALDPATEGAVIASSVGMRKRALIANVADKKGITIINVNMRDPKAYISRVGEELKRRKVSKAKAVQEKAAEEAKAKKTVSHEKKVAGEPKPQAPEQAASEAKAEEKKELDKLLTKREV